MSSNSSNTATVAATNPGNGHDGSSDNDGAQCKSLSFTTTYLSDEKIVFGCSVTDKAIVCGLCKDKCPTGTVDFQVSYEGGCWVTYDHCVTLECGIAVSECYTPAAPGPYEFRAVYNGDCNFIGSQNMCPELLCVTQACTTTTTSVGVTTIEEGQAITDNATVCGLGDGFPVPTGTVTFQVSYNNGTWMTYSANVSLVDGMATSALYTPAEEGYYSFQAIYHGDCNYLCSMSKSGSEILMVTNEGIGQPDDNSTTVTMLSSDHIVLGCSVMDNATVTGGEGGDLSGNVSFQVSYNEGTWKTYDANVTLVDGMASSAWYTPCMAGCYEFRAIYNGNSDILPSMSGNTSEPLTVCPACSQTTTCLSNSQINLGCSVYDTAHVCGLGDGFPAPTGCVTFWVSSDCGNSWTQIGNAVELNNGMATSICYTPCAAGSYEFKAMYGGDCNYLCSHSCPQSEILKVCGECRNITLGQSVTDNATVTGLGDGFPAPTGTVDFQVSYEGGCWVTYDHCVPLVDCQAVSSWYTPLVTGHYDFRAVYSGDCNYQCSVSGNCSEPLCVHPACSTTATMLSASTIALGNSVTDNVTVTGLGGLFPVPIGTVDFQVSYNEGPWTTYDADVALVNGIATSAYYMPLAAGNYEFQAIYSGDSNYRCSVSGEDAELLLVTPGLGASGPTINTDLGVTEICLGHSVTDNATVVGLGGEFPMPTGTITFWVSYNEGPWMIYDANVTLVNGNATSAFYMPVATGSYEFQASYSGDSNYLPSVSGEDAELLQVDMAPSHTTTCLSSGDIVLGCSVYDTAHVCGLGDGFPAPTGCVTFWVSSDCGNSWTQIGNAVELNNGMATSICYTPCAAGSYEFKAMYGGDCNYLCSHSCPGSEQLCVEKAPSYVFTCLGTNNITLGQSVTDNVTVIGLCDGFPVPTGPVTFQVSFNGGDWVTYDIQMLDCHGMATSTWYTPMCAGHYEFRAVYSCDCNYQESSSCPLSEPLCVDRAPSTTTTDLGTNCNISIPTVG